MTRGRRTEAAPPLRPEPLPALYVASTREGDRIDPERRWLTERTPACPLPTDPAWEAPEEGDDA